MKSARQAAPNQFPTSLEELAANPNKWGAPTFEQFRANRAKWKLGLGAENNFEQLDAAGTQLRQILRKVKLQINGLSLPNLEAAEIALKDHGYSIADFQLGRPGHLSRLKYKCEMDKAGEGKFEVTINFLP